MEDGSGGDKSRASRSLTKGGNMGNSPRIGIPRALLYYEYYPMWRTFFENLGAEVVVSLPTTKDVLNSGSIRMVAETCLPVKVFIGHVLSLVGKCDYVFVPAIRSVEKKVHNCSKFLGLPDMTKAAVPESPPILDVDIDVDKGRGELYQAIYRLGRHFTWNPAKVKQAASAAWQVHQTYQTQMSSLGQPPLQAMEKMFPTGETIKSENGSNHSTSIALIGHPYLLYDDYVNYRMLHQLEVREVKVLFPEMVQKEEIDRAIATLVEKAYWTYEDEVVGAGGYYLQSEVDGVIGLVAFGCGPDSMMMGIVQHYARKLGKPFMFLTLDEHASEAGLITRLEAFIDMIHRRNKEKGCA